MRSLRRGLRSKNNANVQALPIELQLNVAAMVRQQVQNWTPGASNQDHWRSTTRSLQALDLFTTPLLLIGARARACSADVSAAKHQQPQPQQQGRQVITRQASSLPILFEGVRARPAALPELLPQLLPTKAASAPATPNKATTTTAACCHDHLLLIGPQSSSTARSSLEMMPHQEDSNPAVEELVVDTAIPDMLLQVLALVQIRANIGGTFSTVQCALDRHSPPATDHHLLSPVTTDAAGSTDESGTVSTSDHVVRRQRRHAVPDMAAHIQSLVDNLDIARQPNARYARDAVRNGPASDPVVRRQRRHAVPDMKAHIQSLVTNLAIALQHNARDAHGAHGAHGAHDAVHNDPTNVVRAVYPGFFCRRRNAIGDVGAYMDTLLHAAGRNASSVRRRRGGVHLVHGATLPVCRTLPLGVRPVGVHLTATTTATTVHAL